MSDDGDTLSVAVDALLARRQAKQDDARQLAALRLAIWRMKHEEHKSAADIAIELRDEARRRGVTPRKGEGVGYESVAKVVGGPRPTEPKPEA